ncbi:MAG: hypothetical protein KGI08_05330 [Thaumarchaeota archaeon]|nr:hypothetical protein [Nitrososphaerota archaeon]
MGKFDRAECPKCGKVANTSAKVEELFGIRNNGGVRMVQSWCKECR